MKSGAFWQCAVLGAVGLQVACGSSPTQPHIFRVVDSVALGGTPFAAAISPSGVTYVTQVHAGTVVRARTPSPPFSTLISVGPLPSQIRVSPNGQTAYVGNQGDGTITFVNVQTDQAFDTVTVTQGSILTIGLSPAGTSLYALTDFHGVYVVDAATRAVVDSIPPTSTGHILTGIAFHPTAPRMYIAARDAGTVAVIDTDAHTVVTTYAVSGGRIQDLAVAGDGAELYGTDIQRSGLVIWNLRSGSPAYVELLIGSGQVRNAFDVAVTPNGAQLLVSTLADGKVYIVDPAARIVVDSIVTGGSPRYIALDTDGRRAVIPNEMGWVSFVR